MLPSKTIIEKVDQEYYRFKISNYELIENDCQLHEAGSIHHRLLQKILDNKGKELHLLIVVETCSNE